MPASMEAFLNAERENRCAFNGRIFSPAPYGVHGDFGNADLLNCEPAACQHRVSTAGDARRSQRKLQARQFKTAALIKLAARSAAERRLRCRVPLAAGNGPRRPATAARSDR